MFKNKYYNLYIFPSKYIDHFVRLKFFDASKFWFFFVMQMSQINIKFWEIFQRIIFWEINHSMHFICDVIPYYQSNLKQKKDDYFINIVLLLLLCEYIYFYYVCLKLLIFLENFSLVFFRSFKFWYTKFFAHTLSTSHVLMNFYYQL